MTSAAQSPEDQAESRLVASAENRIRRYFVVMAAVSELAILITWRWRFAAGFAVGAFVAFLSMAHLQRVVHAFTSRAAGEGSRESAAATVTRFLMRFALVTLGAYVVFRISRSAAFGYVAALFLPVAAMTGEAAHEAWFAIRNRNGSS